MTHLYRLTVLILTLFTLFSCGVNSNLMFKIPKGDEGSYDSVPPPIISDYKMMPDDRFTFTIAPNEGKKIIDGVTATVAGTAMKAENQEYTIRKDGFVELPLLGQVHVAGMSIYQCQDTLKSMYSSVYKDPFVQIKLLNQRVIVFPGDGGGAKVIYLENTNTTLMEAIALAGGISNRGRANQVKLMRQEEGQRKVYTMDLSKIEGLKYADILVQSNDYIYVEPHPRVASETLARVTPFIVIASTVLMILNVTNNLTK